jgi:hypothetical protein
MSIAYFQDYEERSPNIPFSLDFNSDRMHKGGDLVSSLLTKGKELLKDEGVQGKIAELGSKAILHGLKALIGGRISKAAEGTYVDPDRIGEMTGGRNKKSRYDRFMEKRGVVGRLI